MKHSVFVVCVFLFASMMEIVAQDATPASEFKYWMSADGSGVTIMMYTGKASTVIIPSTIEGYPVVEIGLFTFAENTTLESITIPESVKKIGGLAFSYCAKLKIVNIGAKTIEYTENVVMQIPLEKEGLSLSPISCSATFAGCSALELKEQKKIRETGYRGWFGAK